MREQLLAEARELSTSAERIAAILRQAQAELRSYVGSILGSLFSRASISAWRDVLRETAKHPKLSAELLQALYNEHQRDYDIVAAIGENPSAPLPLLYSAWAKAPDSFLQNPIVALLQLESPGFWGLLPAETIKALLGLPNIGVNIFEHAIKHHTLGIREQIAQHPNTPAEIINALSTTHEESLLSKLARHAALSQQHRERLLGHPAISVRSAAAESPAWPSAWVSLIQRLRLVIYYSNLRVQPSLTREECCMLARCGSFLQGYLAQHASTPGAVLAALALSGGNLAPHQRDNLPAEWLTPIIGVSWRELGVLRDLASHPNAPDHLLRQLSRHYRVEVREAILQRPLLNAENQLAFSARVCLKTRTLLSQRRDLTEQILLKLSEDESASIRGNVAANPRMPRPRALEMLYDKSPKIGLTICQQNTDRELLERLTESQHPEVRDAAWARLPGPRRLPLYREVLYSTSEYQAFLQRGPYVIQLLTESAVTPAWVFSQLATSASESKRVAVAQSQYATAAQLASLAEDPSLSVRAAVAKNPKTPPEQLTALAQRGALLAQRCAENPALSGEALAVLRAKPSRAVRLRLLQHPTLPSEAHEELLREAPPGVLRQLARESAAAGLLVEILRLRPHLKIKRLLSQNPHTPKEVLQELAREEDVQITNHLSWRGRR